MLVSQRIIRDCGHCEHHPLSLMLCVLHEDASVDTTSVSFDATSFMVPTHLLVLCSVVSRFTIITEPLVGMLLQWCCKP